MFCRKLTCLVWARPTNSYKFGLLLSCRSLSVRTEPGLSYAVCLSDVPFRYRPISHYLDECVSQYGDRLAVVHRELGRRLTYNELGDYVDRLASGLLAIGLEPGDRVGMLGPSSIEWIVTQYATAKVGLILVNVNPAYKQSELKYTLEQVGCKAIVCDKEYKSSHYYEMLSALCPSMCLNGPGRIDSEDLPLLKHVIVTGDEHLPGSWSFNYILNHGRPVAEVETIAQEVRPDAAINIQFTSGTTGHPKAATLSHFNIVNNAHFVCSRMDYYGKHTKICMPVPMYHCFGMVLSSLCSVLAKGTLVIPGRQFDKAATLRSIAEEQCNVIYGTPTMFIDMLNDPLIHQLDLTSLEKGIMAGATCPKETMRDIDKLMNCKQMCIGYGQTENSPINSLTPRFDSIDKRCSTVGVPLDHMELRITDLAGRTVRTGEPGEICSRGHCVMLGYWGNEEETARSMYVGNWWRSGDVGVMDEDGYIRVIGRDKDMIIRGGENIYPAEIEQYLHLHADVEQAQVVGVPSERLGEEVCVWIKPKTGRHLTSEGIIKYCREDMSHFKVPKYVVFTDSFPMTVTGKIKKYELRRMSADRFSDLSI